MRKKKVHIHSGNNPCVDTKIDGITRNKYLKVFCFCTIMEGRKRRETYRNERIIDISLCLFQDKSSRVQFAFEQTNIFQH